MTSLRAASTGSATCPECDRPFSPEDGDGETTCSVACTDNLRSGDREERAERRAYERTLDRLDAREDRRMTGMS